MAIEHPFDGDDDEEIQKLGYFCEGIMKMRGSLPWLTRWLMEVRRGGPEVT